MAVDAFVSTECPDLPIFVNTPSGFANYISFNTKVANSGSTTATNATLAKTILIPGGVAVIVVDNGGSIIGPANGDAFIGPTKLQFVFTGLTLPAVSGTHTTILGIPVTLADVSLTAPETITDISQIIAPGDINPTNDTAICNISLA
jgi:hypothetical protein